MKKQFVLAVLIFCLLLTGCSKTPAKAVDGTPWNKEWTAIGSTLGVEAREDWVLSRQEDVLAAQGMFYYVWTKGDEVTYTNEFDETVTSHAAEIHLILSESPSDEDAQKIAGQWEELTRERYPEAEESRAVFAGQEFTVSTYTTEQSKGASAAGLRGTGVIRVDVITLDDENPETILADFLNICHYMK